MAIKNRAVGEGWTFTLSDMSGGLAGAAISYNASALRGTAQGLEASARQNLARLRGTSTYPSQFAQRYYDDLAHYDDLVRSSGDDLSRAARPRGSARPSPWE